MCPLQACFGPTVLAYFAFSRWILLNFCFVGLVSVYFFLRHIELGDFSWSTAAEYYMPQVLLPSGYDDR